MILIGNLVADPEYITTQTGTPMTKFRLAVQRKRANSNGVREADFINCVAYRQTADFIADYFIKGRKIGIEGSIRTGSYTAQDGSKRYTTDVVVDNAEFVSSNNDEDYNATSTRDSFQVPGPTPPPDTDMSKFMEVDNDDDLPF